MIAITSNEKSPLHRPQTEMMQRNPEPVIQDTETTELARRTLERPACQPNINGCRAIVCLSGTALMGIPGIIIGISLSKPMAIISMCGSGVAIGGYLCAKVHRDDSPAGFSFKPDESDLD